MLLWPAPITVRMKFHELRHSTNTLLAALGVPETVRADILGHRTRAMTRRYTLSWTKDRVRGACERGELAYARDHLNTYPSLARP